MHSSLSLILLSRMINYKPSCTSYQLLGWKAYRQSSRHPLFSVFLETRVVKGGNCHGFMDSLAGIRKTLSKGAVLSSPGGIPSLFSRQSFKWGLHYKSSPLPWKYYWFVHPLCHSCCLMKSNCTTTELFQGRDCLAQSVAPHRCSGIFESLNR